MYIEMDVLIAFVVEPCQNDREAWCRVRSFYRYRGECVSELSMPLARRILPRWCASLGIDDMGGLFTGRLFYPHRASFAR